MNIYHTFFKAFLPCLLLSIELTHPLSAKSENIDFRFVVASNSGHTKDLFEQGLEAYKSGQLQNAISSWQQALRLSTAPQEQAQTLGNLAIAYFETGQYIKALDANKSAIAIFTDLEQVGAVGQVQSNLGNVYESLGDYDSAITAYQESIRLSRSTGRRQAEGASTANLGHLYSVQDDQTAAIEAYEQSLVIAREIGDQAGESHRLLNMGIAYYELGEVALAKQYYQQSLQIAQAIENRPLEAKVLINLSLAIADSNQYDEAIAYLDQSLVISKSLNDLNMTARILNNLGHTLLAANRLEEAEARLRESVQVLDSLRSGELGDTYNVSIFDTQIYTYNLLTQILVASNQVESALEASESGRTRAFSELLKSRTSGNPPSATANKSLAATPSIADIREIARQQNATLVEYSLVPEDEFVHQGKLRGTTAELYIWVVQPDGTVHFRRSPIDTQTHRLEDLVKTSRTAIGVRNRGFEFADAEPIDSNQNLKTLHQLLIAPIQDLLPTDPEQQVIFIPQGDLFLVPFPALINSAGDYLIQHHTLLTAPSIEILALTQQQQAKLNPTQPLTSADLLIVGNPVMPQVWDARSGQMKTLSPLEGAGQEAIAIATLFNTTALTQAEATEHTIKQRIGNARLVHLATHGLLEYGNPQDSGVSDVPGAIALTPGQGEDGLLTAAEILETLDLQAELVVLSACDTGLGDITGDGVIGLSRALITAGTPSVIVSLWSVPDAPTAQLMTTFYQQLQQNQDKAQALRQAMLETMKTNPDPRDWAAFTLIGTAD
jgi:CHAT domain-containing protein/tetratricopeptide (TPR) repeat protein